MSLTIFVHRASECLTDHLSHGDGLICYSLLGELARRGHRIFAYTNRHSVLERSPNLTIRSRRHRVPANSLGPWEHAWRANRWMRQLEKKHKIDLVWRMHPYGIGCPVRPHTGKRPLVVGPIFYDWSPDANLAGQVCGPRLGWGIGKFVQPIGERGWNRTVKTSSLLLCATDALASQMRTKTNGRIGVVPVIVDPPQAALAFRGEPGAYPKLLFVANLVPNKRPLVFCETIAALRAIGIHATGTVVGDGPERTRMEQWCRNQNMLSAVRFMGRINNAEVYRQLALADGLVSTSYGEPYGRNIAEAMSVGTVPICHRSGGPADFVASGENGLLVDGMEAIAYAEAIARNWVQPGKWQYLSDGAMRKAEEWRPQVVIDRLENELLDLAEHPDRNRDAEQDEKYGYVHEHDAAKQEFIG